MERLTHDWKSRVCGLQKSNRIQESGVRIQLGILYDTSTGSVDILKKSTHHTCTLVVCLIKYDGL
ncbi:hypothetical protein, partial [Nostoc sp. NMS4]|uniref:hypothetical protein n=1 Tax=Nostoc sp. NMS4 TaxID=2815390 RepID=UPI0025E9C3E0